jgi:hypothetical protein
LRRGAIALVGQKVLERREEKRPELALLAIGLREELLRQEVGEERLGQVLGVVRVVPTAAKIGIERIPVRAAKFGKRIGGRRRGASLGGR